ncbi:helix-turn-helix transcriptional regulator [Pseudomonas soli]|uniref:Transcriptional regulator n=1 Tax=Pseudomonas soli TaxID=1306993 RepID=A0A2V4HIE8_9PSED|nr:helix-turn-helix transcriptional regulator [Pseudomonas soli]PYB76115.1 transcriptional regulator [Pseudomonas soli]
MSLRYSFAAVLQLLRTHKGLSQDDLSSFVPQTNVSKLELAKSSVAVDTSYLLAAGLEVEPTTLLALVMASHDHRSARETLLASLAELEALGLADSRLPTEPQAVTRVNVSSARKKLMAVQEQKALGLSQSQAARKLGLPESTLRRLWHQSIED